MKYRSRSPVLSESSRARWASYAQRALELSAKTGEAERYFIRGGYFALTDQYGEMLANYQALLALDPDHYWANQNLYSYYRYVWPWGIEDALPYLLRTAQLRPNSFRHISRTAAYLAIEMNRPREAEPYVQRAADLAATDPAARPIYGVAWVRLYPVHRLWMEGDLEGVLNELDRWRETLRSSVVHDYDLVTKVAGFYVVLGMLEAAEEIFRLIDARSGGGEYLLHEVEYYRMDEKEGAEYLMSHGTDAPLGARRLARAGLLSEARKQPDYLASVRATARWQLSFRNPIPRMSEHQLTQGEVALAEGNLEEAISLLQGGLSGLRSSGTYPYFRCAESLAIAWERQGNLDMALRTLEDASQQKNRTYSFVNDYVGSAKVYWMRVRLRLAQLYRRLDRDAEALEIEAELRELLRYADPDLWLVRQLEAIPTESAPESAGVLSSRPLAPARLATR